MNCCNLKYGYANSQGRAAWLTCVRLLIRRNNIFFGLVRPPYTRADFATRGPEVNSVLREWRGKVLGFFSPLYSCSFILSLFRTAGFFSSPLPLEDCPLAFWSCIKEEMGGKKRYWFCVLSDSNTEDRKTHKESGVGSGAALSLVWKKKAEKSGRRWGATPDDTNSSLPRVMCLVLLLPSFLLLLSVIIGGVNKAPLLYHLETSLPPPTATSGSFSSTSSSSSSSIRPVTPELWQHAPVDLLFHETPSCSLLSSNQIFLRGEHAGSRQEEEYCLWALSPPSHSCVSPAEVRQDWTAFQVSMWPVGWNKRRTFGDCRWKQLLLLLQFLFFFIPFADFFCVFSR